MIFKLAKKAAENHKFMNFSSKKILYKMRPFFVSTKKHVKAVYTICILAFFLNKFFANQKKNCGEKDYLQLCLLVLSFFCARNIGCIYTLQIAAHDFKFQDDPTRLGHESVGTAVEVLSGSSYKVGDRVIIFQGDYCGRCQACRNCLSPTCCQSNNPDTHGVEHSAMKGIEYKNESESGSFAMAQYRIAPIANLYRIPDAVDFRYAAACNCSSGVGFSNQEVMNVKAGHTVIVGGVGFIAMDHIIYALYRNATVIALIRNLHRKEMLVKMGVEHFVNSDDDYWLEQVQALIYEGQGADHAVDGSGVAHYQEKLMTATRIYGSVNFSGHTPGARINLSPLRDVTVL